MSLINVTNVEVLDNPSQFTNPFQFVITFECLPPGVQEELEWKVTYVGSSEDEKYDQELDSVLVGPVSVGKNKFVFQAPAPDLESLPLDHVIGVTVVLLTCSYKGRQFIRVGYYVSNDYADEETKQAMGDNVDFSKLVRNICSDQPRVTRFNIVWDNEEESLAQEMNEFDMANAAEMQMQQEEEGYDNDNNDNQDGMMDDNDDELMDDYDDDDNNNHDDIDLDDYKRNLINHSMIVPQMSA